MCRTGRVQSQELMAYPLSIWSLENTDLFRGREEIESVTGKKIAERNVRSVVNERYDIREGLCKRYAKIHCTTRRRFSVEQLC